MQWFWLGTWHLAVHDHKNFEVQFSINSDSMLSWCTSSKTVLDILIGYSKFKETGMESTRAIRLPGNISLQVLSFWKMDRSCHWWFTSNSEQ